MKYKAILRAFFKKCLFAPLHTISVGRNFFMCQKVLIANLNAVTDSVGPDGNIHKEQSGQGQHCLPSYTGSFNSVKL